MSTHYDDEAQVEELRRWWKENWKPLAAGLALGLVVIFGWDAYGRSRDARRAEAAQLFTELGQAATAGKYDEAAKMADRLAADFESTPYAAAGALKLAQAAVEANKLDDAATRLQWAAAHADDKALKPLIALRLARVLWQQGKPDEALKGLEGDAGTYAGLYAELRGDIKLSQGDRAAARAAYEQAIGTLDDQQAPARDALQLKLDDLADAAVVKS